MYLALLDLGALDDRGPLAMSAFSRAAISSGVLAFGSVPRSRMRFLISGSAMISTISLLSLATIVGRRSGGRKNRVPADDFVFQRAGFAHRRNIRQRPGGAGGRDRADHVGVDAALERGIGFEPDHDVVAHQRGLHFGRTLERDDVGVDAGGGLEQFRRQVLRAAGIDRADVDLAGARLGQQIADGLDRRVGVDQQQMSK